MRYLIFILALLINSTANAQEEVLTNKDITVMKSIGFSDEIILSKIKTSTSFLFSTEIDSLKYLKEKGISDAIIISMMEKGKTEAKIESEQEKSLTDSLGIGLYMMDKPKLFTKILPSIFSGTKTNTLASAFTYGIVDSEISVTLDKPYSEVYTKSKNPDFFFLFEEQETTKTESKNDPFVCGSSPKKFALVKLYTTNKKRKMRTGKVNIYAGISTGVNDDDIIDFSTIQINSHAFKVVLNAPLSPGEYGFVYQGYPNDSGFSRMIYDFSIE